MSRLNSWNNPAHPHLLPDAQRTSIFPNRSLLTLGASMDLTCLDHLLTEEEAQQFEEEGFFVLPECLTDDEVDRLY